IVARIRAANPTLATRYRTESSSGLGVWYCAGLAKVFGTRRQPPKLAHISQPPGKPAQIDSTVAQAQMLVDTLQIATAIKQINMYEVEIQKKFAISIACLFFALLGPPIALRFPRGGIGLTIGVSLTAFALYYVGLIAGEKLSDHVKVS